MLNTLQGYKSNKMANTYEPFLLFQNSEGNALHITLIQSF